MRSSKKESVMSVDCTGNPSLARERGRVGGGKAKRFSAEERERRRQRMVEMNKMRAKAKGNTQCEPKHKQIKRGKQ